MSSEALKLLTVAYPAGQRIVGSGERGNCMFVVHNGTVRLSRANGGEASPTEIGVLEKGDFFGEGALLEGRPYSSDAEAVTDCEVVEIGPSTFQRMLETHPEIAVRMLRKLAGRLERVESRLTESGVAEVQAAPEPRAPSVREGEAGPQAGEGRFVIEDSEEVFPLHGVEVLVGRYDPVTEVQPEVDLSSVDSKRSVSRRHARLRFEDGEWHVMEEVGTLNGTYVNGTRIQTGRSVVLKDGDVVSLGMVRMTFRDS